MQCGCFYMLYVNHAIFYCLISLSQIFKLQQRIQSLQAGKAKAQCVGGCALKTWFRGNNLDLNKHFALLHCFEVKTSQKSLFFFFSYTLSDARVTGCLQEVGCPLVLSGYNFCKGQQKLSMKMIQNYMDYVELSWTILRWQ